MCSILFYFGVVEQKKIAIHAVATEIRFVFFPLDLCILFLTFWFRVF